MITLNFKNLLSLLLIGFVLGLFSSSLFTGCNKIVVSKTQVAVSPKQLKKQADTIQEHYQKQIENLQDQNLQLQQNLEVTQSLLEHEKQLAKQKESKIKKVIQPIGLPAKELLAKRDSPVPHNASSPCDSIAGLVVEYIEGNHIKDSLYDEQITQLDSIASVKDELIQANEKAYTSLNLLFNQSLTAQKSLASENKLLQRQFKRQRVKNRLATAGLMILTATATKLLLHH